MATLALGSAEPRSAERSERKFFLIMAIAMAATIVAGFSLNLAMHRSTFAVPWPYHVHAFIFMGWVALYLAQSFTIATGRRALHITLGKLGYVWIPAMTIAGVTIMTVVARTNGGPFFFAINEFLISNVMLLGAFAATALWALRRRRHQGWHRRLLLASMAVLTGPGLGRLLPMPLMIPYAWTISFVASLVWIAIAMVYDVRRRGQVHPAYKWALAIYGGTFLVSMGIAFSPVGYAITHAVIDGTPGAARPMQAFLPPGFSM
jgi:hypothetical protein